MSAKKIATWPMHKALDGRFAWLAHHIEGLLGSIPGRPPVHDRLDAIETLERDLGGHLGLIQEKLEAMDMGDAGIYQIYGRHGIPLGGMFNKPAEMPGPPGWLYYIRVEDVRGAADRVHRLGGRVLNGPMEVPGGDLIAQCMDPQGAMFALHSSTT